MEHTRALSLAFTVIVLGLVLRIAFIWSQPPLEDDHLFVMSAENYLERGQIGPSMIHHPNLRNILLYGSTRLFGTGRAGVWGVSILSGILSIILLYLIGMELFKDYSVALTSCLFLAIDPLHIAFSRQAIQETTTLFLVLLSLYFFLLFLRKGNYLYLLLTGVSSGLGIASKWQALFTLPFYSVYMILTAGQRQRAFLDTIVYLVMIPFATYLATFIPWFSRGFDLFDWFRYQAEIFYLNQHHVNPTEDVVKNPGNPLLWFLLPQGYASFTFSDGKPYVLIGMANPLVWLLTIPALLLSLLRAFRKSHPDIMLAGLFLFSYIPFVIASFKRDIYVLSALSIIPFAFLSISGMLKEVPIPSRWKAIYLIMAITASLLLYPLSIGQSLEFSYLRPIVEMFNPHF